MNHVTPLWIRPDPVDISLRRGTETDDDDVFQVVTAPAGSLQKALDEKTFQQGGGHTDDIEGGDQASRYVFDLHKENVNEKEQDAARVGLNQILVLSRLILKTFWLIKVKLGI